MNISFKKIPDRPKWELRLLAVAQALAPLATHRDFGPAVDRAKQLGRDLVSTLFTRDFYINGRTYTASIRHEIGKIFMITEYLDAALKFHGLPTPKTVVVLGSALGALADEMDVKFRIKVEDIPGWPRPESVPAGHAGEVLVGVIQTNQGPRYVLVLSGRVHQYQEVGAEASVRYVRALRLLGAKKFILTNAAGAAPLKSDISIQRKVGDLSVSKFQTGSPGTSPFRFKQPGLGIFGAHDFAGFPLLDSLGIWKDLESALVDAGLLKREADLIGTVEEHPCIHWGDEEQFNQEKGPDYEQPGLISRLIKQGVSLFGMSSAWELAAVLHRYFSDAPGDYIGDAEGLIITNITNIAAGIDGATPDHGEVGREGRNSAKFFVGVLKVALAKIAEPWQEE